MPQTHSPDSLPRLLVENGHLPEEDLSRPLFSISTVARRCGVSAAAIRSWEERYGVVVPQRDGSGRRLYSALELAQISWLARQIAAGMSASEAHRLLEADPSVALEEVRPVSPPKPIPWTDLVDWISDEKGWLEAFLADATVSLSAPSLLFGVLHGVSHGPLLVLVAEPPASQPAASRLLSRLSRPVQELSAVPVPSVPHLAESLMSLGTFVDMDDPFAVAASCTVVTPIALEGHPVLAWVSFCLSSDTLAPPLSLSGELGGEPAAVSALPPQRLVSAAQMAAQAIGARLLAAQTRRSFESLMR